MGTKQLVIGMFGFGNVGRGLYDVLNTISSKEAKIKRVCVRDLSKERGVEEDFFTDNADDIFNDEEPKSPLPSAKRHRRVLRRPNNRS